MTKELAPVNPFAGIGPDMVAQAAGGLLAGGLLGAFAGSLVPLLSRALELAHEELDGGQLRALTMWGHAGEAAWQPVEQLMDRARVDPDRRHLAVTAAQGASTSRYPARIVALGRALAAGLLAESETRLDIEQVIIDVLGTLDRPHIRTLAAVEHPDAARARSAEEIA